MVGFCECGNELLGFVEGWEFFDEIITSSRRTLLCPLVRTFLHEEGGKASSASYYHACAQSPAPPPTVHGGPQEKVRGQFNCSCQEEVEELVTTEYWRVVG